ncbi:hypothetical protein IMCC26134_03345 [Verrucomicrobia bacterium IMCC26134]|nr:hypothetical protein IMCC26134_03345 [Verrucomicrobia bacterium IMCC26134]
MDQTVLDMIEHSPAGAVPHTPAYQDALVRLRAAHQVYVAADHKNGFVTVRSLSALPSFYAQNLEAFLAGKVEVSALESEASIYSRYVKSLSAALQVGAEERRAAVVAKRTHHRPKQGAEVVQDPAHTIFLIAGAGPNPGLPGNYLYGSVQQSTADAVSGDWTLHVHDREDGAAVCEVHSQAEAFEKLQEVLASAPFLISELASLGFRMT